MERRLLGILAVGFAVFGALGTFTAAFGDGSEQWGGVLLRSAMILGVLWLVIPKARQVPRPVWAGVGVFGGVLAIYPRLVLLGLLLAFFAMVAVAIMQRRARR